MIRAFSDIDNIYSDVLLQESSISDGERINYCKNAMNKAKFMIEVSQRYLTVEQRQTYLEVVIACKNEISRLRRKAMLGNLTPVSSL